jgi:AbrB family looped-hinge helix DNA binding protein
MKTITLSSKNQVVIPKLVRGKMQLSSGDQLIVEQVTKGRLVLKKAPSYHDLVGTIKPGKDDAAQRVRTIRDNWRESDS